MRTIYTRKGQPIYVDDWNYDWLVAYSGWYISGSVRSTNGGIKMHRLITGVTDPKADVDHRNHQKNDNREENLRVCTHAENMKNRKINANSTSGYKGVVWVPKLGKWLSHIAVDGKRYNLGYYKTPEEAYAAYCTAARQYHKEFANFG